MKRTTPSTQKLIKIGFSGSYLLLFLIGIMIYSTYVQIKQPNIHHKDLHNYQLTLTAYTVVVGETDSNPKNTAIMERPKPGGTAAISQDMIRYLGQKVYISGFGIFRVNDLMNKRYTKSIDLCVPDKTTAKKIGRQEIKVVFIVK